MTALKVSSELPSDLPMIYSARLSKKNSMLGLQELVDYCMDLYKTFYHGKYPKTLHRRRGRATVQPSFSRFHTVSSFEARFQIQRSRAIIKRFITKRPIVFHHAYLPLGRAQSRNELAAAGLVIHPHQSQGSLVKSTTARRSNASRLLCS